MNKDLFINGYIERIAKKFDLIDSLAFEILSIAAILDLSFDEVYDFVSTIENKHGGHDGGLDGIYLDEDEDVLHIFQVKSSIKPIGDNEIAKFIDDFDTLFVYGNPVNKPLNKKVSAELEKYRNLAKSGRIFDTKLYFIFKGDKSEQDVLLINRHIGSAKNLQVLDSNDLYEQIDSLVSEGRKRKSIDFSFMAEKSNIGTRTDPQTLISFAIQNVKAVNFRLSTLELCQLLDEEKRLNNRIDSIFSDNVRGFLNYNKTNKNIRDTLLNNSDAEYFPFLNNGITVIAERVNIPNAMQAGLYPIKTTNPVIVNGLQTTYVIYDIYQKDKAKLEGVYVLVRLYETTDIALIDKITDATNTQSPINYRDKISNRKFNEHTRAAFANVGIIYLSKRGETFDVKLKTSFNKSVHSETVLKFWYASFYGYPEIAKNSKSKVLEELFDATTNKDNKLNELFNGDKNSAIYQQLLEAFWLYDFIMQKRKTMDNKSDFVLFADELFAYGVYRLFRKNGCFNLNTELFKSYYQEIYQAIENCVNKRITKLSKDGHTYSHNGYFKSSQSRTDLNDEINLWLPEDNL